MNKIILNGVELSPFHAAHLQRILAFQAQHAREALKTITAHKTPGYSEVKRGLENELAVFNDLHVISLREPGQFVATAEVTAVMNELKENQEAVITVGSNLLDYLEASAVRFAVGSQIDDWAHMNAAGELSSTGRESLDKLRHVMDLIKQSESATTDRTEEMIDADMRKG